MDSGYDWRNDLCVIRPVLAGSVRTLSFYLMHAVGRAIYWILTALSLLLLAFAVWEFSAADTAKGNALMRAGLYFIGAVALWSFGRAVLRALAGR